ncbi:MAG: ferrous iron transporter B [Phycisphaerae bacterium]|nr:ferrous iron transporter B [Phycisphaerae bacterium]
MSETDSNNDRLVSPGNSGRGCIALVGNPNTGKTTLFNRLCGLRARTANLPGSTIEAHIGSWNAAGTECQVVDLPGIYGLGLDRPESRVCREYLDGSHSRFPDADCIIVVVDATNLRRNLLLVGQILELGKPVVVALNMIDIARKRRLKIDPEQLSRELGCPVVELSARLGEGIGSLADAVRSAQPTSVDLPPSSNLQRCEQWSRDVADRVGGDSASTDTLTARLDVAFTHPVMGLLSFIIIMIGIFWCIFAFAAIPMDLIDLIFGMFSEFVSGLLPEGLVNDLMVDGIIAGIGGTVIFLPQICLLFFLITLLEDTGYLARAAFVLDRVLRPFGLSGHSFIPMLSAHACALPAIMSARMIPGRLERLATILVAPFLTCSARIPVYVLLVGFLFGDDPLLASLAFAGCYVLGGVAALLCSLVLRHTMLRGASMPMVIELPDFRMPSVRTAIVTTIDRGWVFLKNAGTVILGISIILWWLSAFPVSDPPLEAVQLRQAAEQVSVEDPDAAGSMIEQADVITGRDQVANSFAGRIGRFAEPVFKPLGFDWQLSIGVITSFAAREVFVSTMAILFSGTDDPDEEGVLQRIAGARRSDGSAVFTIPTSASLLVFYVLAMQCLPTLAVTRRETGSWNWAILQLVFMSAIAWIAAWITYMLVSMGGFS